MRYLCIDSAASWSAWARSADSVSNLMAAGVPYIMKGSSRRGCVCYICDMGASVVVISATSVLVGPNLCRNSKPMEQV